jgi:hypothetical protein
MKNKTNTLMKNVLLFFLLILLGAKVDAQKSVAIDSTDAIVKEWIEVISNEEYINHVSIRGITREQHSSNLKLINLSLADYEKGKYQYAFEDINQIKNADNFPEVERIKLFLQTMTEIKLNNHFKARKWYYVSKNKTPIQSFSRLHKNVENQNLSYNIDNYKRVRGRRITALFIGAGAFFLIGEIGNGA